MLCHNYIFLSSNSTFHPLSKQIRYEYTTKFLHVLMNEKDVTSYTYATLGLKANTNILLWLQSESIDNTQNLLNMLMHTRLGDYLTITYTLFGMTRQTQYSTHAKGHLDTSRKGGKYLIIYPFTKNKDWYMLDFETRRNLIGGHVSIGKKHDKISQLLLYSFGIDDSEFIVSYETDDLSAFQTLVMELRSDKVRSYTLKDTPIFTCIYKTPQEVLTFI